MYDSHRILFAHVNTQLKEDSIMSMEDYEKALKAGQKDYHSLVYKGAYPYLPVLDDILSRTDIESRIDLGIIDIPAELIVGTSTQARTTSFSSNFMPLLKADTEFASKWSTLIDSIIEDGQRDPIVAYEFMNKYYVLEGNKRVSVSKYLDTFSLEGKVTRMVPKKTDEPDVIIYFEYLDFYELTKINYIWFTKEGSFPELLRIVSPAPNEPWDDDTRSFFRSRYLSFSKEFKKAGGDKIQITPADAMLAYMAIYDYEEISQLSTADLKKNILKMWDEFLMLQEDESVALVMEPSEAPKKNLLTKLISSTPNKLKVAFIHDKAAETSAWTYGHELGRMHLDQVFSEQLETCCIDNVDVNDENAAFEVIEKAIADGYDTIFTTTPQLQAASLKSAVAHPDIRILNCSLNTSHRYIRTYYGRMYEAKFLTGAIAGAMCENDKIGYVADYPIYGMTANINAFALGAKLVNPRAKIYLEWSTVKDRDYNQVFKEQGIHYISHKELITPDHISRRFGLYHLDENDEPTPLAMPVWHWGVMYEKIIDSILSGAWKNDDTSNQALNYWWGMSSGVIDVISSQKLPISTLRLTEILQDAICNDMFNPFVGVLYGQDGKTYNQKGQVMSPEEIVTIDWLADNIIGHLPDIDELVDEAKAIVLLQGVAEKNK